MTREIDMDTLLRLTASGRPVFLPGAAGEPIPVIDALSRDPASAAGASVVTGHVAGVNRPGKLRVPPTARVTCFFPDPQSDHESVHLERCSYLEIDQRVRTIAPTVAICIVSEPDSAGECAPGVAVDFLEASMSAADIRIALINPLAPRLPNAPKLSISQFTHVLRASFPLLSARSEVADARSEKIAETVARYIVDGATIQTGIGKIPGQIFRKIADRKNLRLHSGILSQDIRLLAEAEALAADNPATSPSAIGDEAFYRWLNGNPVLELAPVAHTHARETLARLEKFVAINSAIEVELLGRVNAEWIGQRRVSAPGGLPNFSRAAAECSDGVSIVALPSTDRSGAVSRIRPRLQDGIEPTVDWRDVDVVVTEYGAADLRGLDAAGRAAALITVAAPDHRRVLSDSLDVAVR